MLRSDGTAAVPRDAPDRVRGLIAAANEIVGKPYRWGGGHGQLADSGYDCSGAVSYALIGAHLLPTPLSSALFAGALPAGAGRWISVYGSPRTTPISRSPGCAWTRARSPTPPACRACAGDRRSASARDSRPFIRPISEAGQSAVARMTSEALMIAVTAVPC